MQVYIRDRYRGDLSSCKYVFKEGKRLEEAVRKALKEIHGSYAIGVINENEPDVLIGARNGSPLVAGIGNGEYFIASDIPAILNHTRDVIFLDDNEMIIPDRRNMLLQIWMECLLKKRSTR